MSDKVDWREMPIAANATNYFCDNVDELVKLALRVPPEGKGPRAAVEEMRDHYLSSMDPDAAVKAAFVDDQYEREQRMMMAKSHLDVAQKLGRQLEADPSEVLAWLREQCARAFDQSIAALKT